MDSMRLLKYGEFFRQPWFADGIGGSRFSVAEDRITKGKEEWE